jgi:hypothetical protein
MNLKQATHTGVIHADVKEIAVSVSAPAGLVTYRGIVRCSCGAPVPVHIETLWQNQQPTLLRVAICAENCPDCGAGLSPPTVTYAGIYSPGFPFIPATTISDADLHYALALMELKDR